MSAVVASPVVKASLLAAAFSGCLLTGCKTSPLSEDRSAPTRSAVTAEAPVATGEAPRPPAAATRAGTSAATVAVGRRDPTILATFEGDVGCTRLVAPFEVSENLAELGTLLLDLSGSSLASMLNSTVENVGRRISPRQGLATSTSAARHQIAYQTRAAALRMNWLPMHAEVAYGKYLLKSFDDELLPRDSTQGRRLYVQAEKMLEDILKGVNEESAYRFEIHLRTSAGENAMALPGGLLLVDAALVRDPQLRSKALFALAHEIGHVLQRHETRAVQARIIDAISLQGTAKDLFHIVRTTRADAGPLVSLLAQGKRQFQRHYSSQEMHSDGCAVRILDRALQDRPALLRTVREFASALVAANPVASKTSTPLTQRDPPYSPQSVSMASARVADEAANLFTFVTQPIEGHPAPKERIDHLEKTIQDLVASTKASSAAPAAGKEPSAIRIPAPPTRRN